VRPGAFVSVCYPKPFARAQTVRLFASFSTPKRALGEPWYELRTGAPVTITTQNLLGEIIEGLIPVRSYRDIALAYMNRPETKFRHGLGPCLPDSVGTLQRRHVHATGVEHLGKEANLLHARIEGGDAANHVQQVYADQALTELELGLLAALRPRELASEVGISERALRDILSRRRDPRASTVRALRTSLGSMTRNPAVVEPAPSLRATRYLARRAVTG
jgi:hypothetical protein